MFALTTVPKQMVGAVNCVDFINGSTRFGMCLPDETQAKNIINAVSSFFACRAGDNLRKVNPKDIIKAGCKIDK
jgi:hypothetical protein